MAMEIIAGKFPEHPTLKTTKLVLRAQICLRLAAFVTTLAATWKMIVSKQTVILFGISFQARYIYSPTFKYFVFANAFACGFTLISLLCVFFFNRRGFTPANYFSLFIHDLLMMSLVLSSVAAGTAIGYVGRYGNSHTGWMNICDNLAKFCNDVAISIVLSYVSVFCLLLLTIISASKSGQIQVKI